MLYQYALWGTREFHQVNVCRSSPVNRVTEEQEELTEEFKLFR